MFPLLFCGIENQNPWIEAIDAVKAVRVERITYGNRSFLPISDSADTGLFQVIITTREIMGWLGEKSTKRTIVYSVDHLRDSFACKCFWESYIREWVRCRVAEMIP